MPELAEVEYYRRQWSPGIGANVLRVQVHGQARVFRGMVPESIVHGLAGARFRESFAHGKQMLFGFSGGFWLGIHLGMSGELLCLPPDAAPLRHDHLVLHQKARTLVFRDPRMFGRVRLDQGRMPPGWWRDLPPEILSRELSAERMTAMLQRRAKSPLKPLLLDQSIFPGIGNWMADEILWRLRVHPSTPAGSLGKAAKVLLHETVQAVCREALKVIATTWGRPPASWLFPHRWKDGGSCPRCDAPLLREALRGRTTCWCPKCQRVPR
ncbi:MAG: Fpg/Nei family DNA glycosylase [Verrucomicrobiales bacterium]|nr:Fpg/Nei family DNA glycosylase [Verrucomicrobiales bacterium]